MQNPLTRISLQNSGVELVKWFALLCMLLDHINKYLFNYSIEYFYEIGRLAMPLFGLVLAYNLARPSIHNKPEVFVRVIKRLLFYGTLCTPAYISLGGVMYGWWPLNILFTLAVALTIMLLLELRSTIKNWPLLVAIVFAFGGCLVEFWWPAVALVVSAWLYFKSPSYIYLTIVAFSFAGLCYVNGNLYAILALPVFYIAGNFSLPIVRLRWLFYGFYLLQFAAFYFIRIPMSKAGYIFLI